LANDTHIAVDVAKAVFEIAISYRPGHVVRRSGYRAPSSLVFRTSRTTLPGSLYAMAEQQSQQERLRPIVGCPG
jgi:hypothetical protein